MGKDDVTATKAMAEANKLFATVGAVIEKQVAGGADQLDLLAIGKATGLEITDRILVDLELERHIHIIPWLPWQCWFPWRPIWCWWWRCHYPWFRCWPWWWHCCCHHHHRI